MIKPPLPRKVAYFSTQSRLQTPKDFTNKYVSESLKKYFHLKQFDRAMNLACRLEDADWVPSRDQTDYLVSILADKHDAKTTDTCLLNLLGIASVKSLKLSQQTIRRLTWQFSHSHDPLLRVAATDYFAVLAKKFRELGTTIEPEAIKMRIRGCLDGKETDRVMSIYNQLKSESKLTLGTIPFNDLIKYLVREEQDFFEAMKVCEDASTLGHELPTTLLLLVLESSINCHSVVGVEFSWTRVNRHSVSDNLLLRAVEVSSEHGKRRLVESMVVEYVSRTRQGSTAVIPRNLASSIVHNISSQSNLHHFLRTMNILHLLQPDLCIRDFPDTIEPFSPSSITALDNFFDTLTSFCIENETHDSFKTFVMNLILANLRTVRSPSAMFYMYRKFQNLGGYTPNAETFNQLVLGAYRLGNSKKLGYLIYDECVNRHNIVPTRLALETLLRISLTGRKYDSIFYFLYVMRKYQIPLREHQHWSISRRFEKSHDSRYKNLFTNLSKQLAKYEQFTSDEVLETSNSIGLVPYSFKRDSKNCQDFVNGWNPDYVVF